MNIMSINICGIRDRVKRRRISNLCSVHGVTFLGLQELRVTNINMFELRSTWGNFSFDFAVSSARGLSGGLISLWDPAAFTKKRIISMENLLIVEGEWVFSKFSCFLMNVYAPQNDVLKRNLWECIKEFMEQNGGEYVIFGDFNAVQNAGERWGCLFSQREADDFNLFIMESGLNEVQMGGFAFTRGSRKGDKMSKLDRFFITEGVAIQFQNLEAMAISSFISDHRPIVLREVVTDFGPSPFRFFNSWMNEPGFEAELKNWWGSNCGKQDQSAAIYLKNKFKMLKDEIKSWWNKIKVERFRSKKELLDKINEIDLLMDVGVATSNEVEDRIQCRAKLYNLENKEMLDLAQKAKIKWSIEGDENSKFFHGILNRKRRQVSIKGVKVDGIWISDALGVKNTFFEYFNSKFQKVPNVRIETPSSRFPRLSEDEVSLLDSVVSMDELKAAVWSCGGDRAPGPDGFTFCLLKRYWDVFKDDIFNFVEEFFRISFLPSGCNSSFITLIPKVSSPLGVADYRPISLIGVQYKIVAKILALRLASVVDSVVSMEQSAFVKGRQILDGPLMVNEILAWVKKRKEKLMILKIDFEKAYDSISWDYLDQVLGFMNFSSKWRGWIRACLHSSRSSVLINGSPTNEFRLHRGLRQGDPLSPFLFILAMEGLLVAIEDAISVGLFAGVLSGQPSLKLSHFFYADDALFLGEWSKRNVENLVGILNCIFLVSGLKINLGKSKLFGMGIPFSEVEAMAMVVGVEKIKYRVRKGLRKVYFQQ